MSTTLRSLLRDACRLIGLDVRRYRPSGPSLLSPLVLYGVDAIFDIGANIGMTGSAYRASGFRGPIVSFEPVSHLFAELQRRSLSDPHWYAEHLALGATPGFADIHVTAGHGGASSLLVMTENVLAHAPDQFVIRTESVRVSTLDQAIQQYYPCGDRLFLQIDAPGDARRVLEGARSTMSRIVGLKVQLSLVENYRGESLLAEMLPLVYRLGFRTTSFEPAWVDHSTGELFQVDVSCFRIERVVCDA